MLAGETRDVQMLRMKDCLISDARSCCQLHKLHDWIKAILGCEVLVVLDGHLGNWDCNIVGTRPDLRVLFVCKCGLVNIRAIRINGSHSYARVR